MSAVPHSPPDLSVVLPCYSATSLAHHSCRTLASFLDRHRLTWEVIVVDDGGNAFDQEPLPDDTRIILLRHPKNLGKGAAVRTGTLASTGAICLYTDIDLPYDLELIPLMTGYIRQGFHLAIGDRTMPGSEYGSRTSALRQGLSAMGAFFFGSFVTGGFHDTQCGIKALRGDIAREMFRLVTIRGFAFDVEVLYLALKHHLDIKRVPVQLRHNDTSSVRVLRDSVRSLVDILGIKSRQLRGKYRSRELAQIVQAEAAVARSRVMPPG